MLGDENFAPWQAVLKNVHGLARHCHYDVAGFPGPHMGIRKKARNR